jgi:hypothetical protein
MITPLTAADRAQVGVASLPAKTLLSPNFAIATNKYSMMRLRV